MYPSTEGLVLWRRDCVLTKGLHWKRLPLGLQQSILLQHYCSCDILMLSLVTLSATFPNVYGPAIFQQQQLQRQPQKEGKMYTIKSSRDGCILAPNIATSCLIFPWQSSQTLLGYGAFILKLSTYEGKLTRPTTMNNIKQAVSFSTKQKAWNLDYIACKESSVQ